VIILLVVLCLYGLLVIKNKGDDYMRPILFSKMMDFINKVNTEGILVKNMESNEVDKGVLANKYIGLENLIRAYMRESQFPIAEPKTPLQMKKLVTKDSLYIPSSLGADGFVYGVVADSNIIWRSDDGMETIEEVEYDFFSEGYYYPYWVTKTEAGFVVITGNRYGASSPGPNIGAVFFSELFDSGYVLKTPFTPNHTPSEFGITYYHGKAISEQIILIAERGFPAEGEELGKIRGTFDGGRTWRIVSEYGEVVNSDQNTHFHTCAYDPYRGRIWISRGDGDNGKLLISDDLGSTWREVKPENNLGRTKFQPTLLLPLANNIIFGPDGGFGVGVLKIPVDKTYYNKEEHFALVEGAFCWDQKWAASQYPISSYAVDGNVAYVVMDSTYYGNGKSFVMATGDGGNTWHTVAGFNYSHVLGRGIIGPDANGNLYGIWNTTEEPNTTAIFDMIEWEKK